MSIGQGPLTFALLSNARGVPVARAGRTDRRKRLFCREMRGNDRAAAPSAGTAAPSKSVIKAAHPVLNRGQESPSWESEWRSAVADRHRRLGAVVGPHPAVLCVRRLRVAAELLTDL